MMTPTKIGTKKTMSNILISEIESLAVRMVLR